MRRLIPLGMVLVACLHGVDSLAADPKVGVRDNAGMFGAETIREADRQLQDLRRAHRWEVVVQTFDSLDGKDIKDRALEEARALKVRGLLVLIAKRDHKVWIEPSNSARGTFSRERVQAIAKTLTSDFKAGEFDRGLRDALAEIRKDADADASASVPAAKPKEIEPVTAPAPPVERNPMAGPPIERRRLIPMLLVGGLGAIALIYLIGRALGRAQANTPPPQGGYAPAPPPPQGGYAPAPPSGPGPRPAPPSGQPGYGPPPGPGYPAGGGYGPGYPQGGGYGAPPPRQGGGFVSGALGGLGGAVLGNVLYDKFGRPHTPEGQPLPMPPQNADHAGTVPPVSTGGPAEPPAPTETYDPNAGAGADWGDQPDPSSQPNNADWQASDAGAGGDWSAPPENAAGGDWGDQEPAQDDSASAGGDWSDDAGGTDPDTSGDEQGAGGSW